MIRSKIIILVLLIIAVNDYVISSDKKQKRINHDITFFVAADLHFDSPPESDQYFHVVAMNSVCGSIKNKQGLSWPSKIESTETMIDCAGTTINVPRGVVLVGDITDRADPSALELFKKRYEIGNALKQIHFPVYIGLGNHDLDPIHVEEHEKEHRKRILDYLVFRHNGKSSAVPVDNVDVKSFNYSWNWGNLHLIQTNRFAGNTENGQVNSLEWLKKDLKKYASDGRPVIIFQHYGFDKSSLGSWNEEERNALKKVIQDYNIIGIFVGHNHFAENLEWEGIPIFQVNNAWKDDDGNGSFAICRITDESINVITCRWKDGNGNVELVAPFYTEKINHK